MSQLTNNTTNLQAILDAVNELPEATAPKLQAKTATPSETAQTVKPDSGYDGLSQVSVGAISKTYVGSSVPKQAAQTITPGTADKTIESGRYLTGAQTIKGDANLVADNIKSGVSIFGVTGTLEAGGGGGMQTATVTSTVGMVMESDTIWYLSPNGVESFKNDTAVTFQCVVPSFIVKMGANTGISQLSGGITTLDSTVQYASIYSITGDASFRSSIM